jgi:hypothetical protein
MSPKKRVTGPVARIRMDEAKSMLEALEALRHKAGYGCNDVMRQCIPVLGFRKAGGYYLLPERVLAEVMDADAKTVNRFMRRGQGYRNGGYTLFAAKALLTTHAVIEFVNSLPEVRRGFEFEYFSNAKELDRFLKAAALFEDFFSGIPLQTCLPFSGGPGSEKGAVNFWRKRRNFAGLFRRLNYDHNRALTPQEPVETLTLISDGTTEPFYVLVDVEYNGTCVCWLEVHDDQGSRLRDAMVVVGQSGFGVAPATFQVPITAVGATKSLLVTLKVGSVTKWERKVVVEPYVWSGSNLYELTEDTWEIRAGLKMSLQRFKIDFEIWLSRLFVKSSLTLGLVTKSYLRKRYREIRYHYGRRRQRPSTIVSMG